MKRATVAFLVTPFLVSHIIFGLSTATAFTYTTFHKDVYDTNVARMDSTLGVTGFEVVERFEDLFLEPDLSISWDAGTPVSALTSTRVNTSWAWDGSRYLQNTEGNASNTAFRRLTTFHIDQEGTLAFGVGISQLEIASTPSFTVRVNGAVLIADLTLDPNFTTNARNIYLLIESEQGEPINTVSFDQNEDNPDGRVVFDHLVYTPKPPITVSVDAKSWSSIKALYVD